MPTQRPTNLWPLTIDPNANIGGSRLVDYDGMTILIPLRDIRENIAMLAAEPCRRDIVASVNQALGQRFPDVKTGKAPLHIAMECGQDVALWFANEVIEGRANIEQ